MKKISKLFALTLAFIMAFSVLPVSFAATETCPIIYIPGIAASTLYHDIDDPSSEVVFPSVDEVKKMVTDKIAPALIVYAADKDADKLASVVSDQLNIIFAGWFNDPDGSPAGNSGVIVKYPATVSKNSTVTFNWDWRGDPFDAAAKLNAFVDYVCQKSGSSKVALATHSLGSVVALTYLNVYGDSKISGIVYDTPVIDGVNYIGQFMLGKFETDGEGLVNAVNGIFSASEDKALAESIMDIFSLAGLTSDVSGLLNSVLDDLAPVIYRDTLVPLFARWPSIWAMTPEEDVEYAMDYVFSKYLTDEDSSVLKAKIEKYNSEVREDRYEKLLSFDENGRFALITRYGFMSLPISSKWNETGDSVVDTKSSSLGATLAPYGEVLSEHYLSDKASKYISPDKTVDASTCLFPEKTWFIKNLNHADVSVTMPFYSSLLFGAQEATCDNFTLSRFSAYDVENDTVTEDNSEPVVNKEKSPLEKLFSFLRAFFAKILSIFKK